MQTLLFRPSVDDFRKPNDENVTHPHESVTCRDNFGAILERVKFLQVLKGRRTFYASFAAGREGGRNIRAGDRPIASRLRTNTPDCYRARASMPAMRDATRRIASRRVASHIRYTV